MSIRTDVQGFAPSADGWRLTAQGDEVIGLGMTGEDIGLRYWADPAVPELYGTGDSTGLRLEAPNLYLHDFCLSNDRGTVKGSGIGILHEIPVTLWGLKLHRVAVLYAGRNCLRLDPGGREYNVSPSVRDCQFYGAGAEGVYVSTCNFATFDHVGSMKHGGRGFIFEDCGTPRLNVGAENVAGGILLRNVLGGTIDCSHIEQFAGATREPAIILDNCRGVTVRGCNIEEWSDAKPTGILLRNGTTRCVIEPNMHAGVGLSVDDGGCSGNVIHRQTWPTWHPEVPWRVSSRRNTVIG